MAARIKTTHHHKSSPKTKVPGGLSFPPGHPKSNEIMKPKPSQPHLTKAGTVRQRAPAAGAPRKNRRVYLSRVSPECLANFQTLAAAIAPKGKTPSLVDAIEHAARVALTQARSASRD